MMDNKWMNEYRSSIHDNIHLCTLQDMPGRWALNKCYRGYSNILHKAPGMGHECYRKCDMLSHLRYVIANASLLVNITPNFTGDHLISWQACVTARFWPALLPQSRPADQPDCRCLSGAAVPTQGGLSTFGHSSCHGPSRYIATCSSLLC